MFVKTALLVLKKDFAIELKSGEMFYTTIFFAVACTMIFAFAFVRDGEPIQGTTAGILWISVLFAGNLALGRTFERERYGETIRALLLAPSPRAAVYVGKLLGIVLLMALAEALVTPMVAVLFHEPLFRTPGMLVLILLTGTVGFATVGTLFAAMLLRTRTREILLPILLYPVTVPVIIASVLATSALLEPEPNLAMARFWISMLVAFDVVFVVLSLWTFEPLMTE
jgi:heme exporter protein CcmB